MSTIKINRAVRLTKMGAYPTTTRDMLRSIPQAVVEALNSRQLAQLLDANWDLAQRSKAIALREGI